MSAPINDEAPGVERPQVALSLKAAETRKRNKHRIAQQRSRPSEPGRGKQTTRKRAAQRQDNTRIERSDPESADDGAPDSLVPDSVFCAELGGISKMTLARYDNYPPDPDFPVKVKRSGRSYRFRSHIERYKGKLLAVAVRSQR